MSGRLGCVSVCHKMASRWRRAYRRDGASIYDMAVTLILRSVKHDPCQTNKGCGSSMYWYWCRKGCWIQGYCWLHIVSKWVRHDACILKITAWRWAWATAMLKASEIYWYSVVLEKWWPASLFKRDSAYNIRDCCLKAFLAPSRYVFLLFRIPQNWRGEN